MTRNEFIETINSWAGLKEFCDDTGCEYLADIYDAESMNDEINDFLADYARDHTWVEVRDALYDIPNCDYGYFACNGSWNDWNELDDESDFEAYKSEVLRWADDQEDVWEFDEEDEPEQEDSEIEGTYDESDDDAKIEVDEFDINHLIGVCCITMDEARVAEEERKLESERALNTLISIRII